MSHESSPEQTQQCLNFSTSWSSPIERKETLRAVLSRAQALQDEHGVTMENVEEVIVVADKICLDTTIEDKATCQDEIVMDSQVMTATSRVYRTMTAELTKQLSPYNIHDFAEKLLIYIASLPDTTLEEVDFSMLEDEMEKRFKRTPEITNLSGCLERQEKKQIVKRQPVKRDTQAPMKRVEAIVKVETGDKSVEETVRKIKKLITERCRARGVPLDFHKLVIHPEKFGKTVENLLHVSFLVRDGLMMLSTSEDGNFVIEPPSKEMRNEAKKSDTQRNVQNVVTMNVKQWRTLIELKQIREPMMDF